MARRCLRAAVLLLACALPACNGGEAPPALQVDDITFAEAELGALSDARRQDLATLTAFGLAVSRNELDRLGRPVTRKQRRSRLLQKLAREVALEQAGVDDAELRRRYRQDPEHELVVRHILFMAEPWQPDSVHQAARRAASAALERARSGDTGFARLAADLSDEPGAEERGGRISPGRRGDWVEPFWAAAAALDEGEISDVVRTRYGYHVIKLEERRIVPFEEVRDQVLDRLVEVDSQAGRAQAWADSAAGEIVLDTRAIDAWRAGRTPDSTVLARWPDGRYTAAEFRGYLATLDADARDRLEAVTTDRYAAVVRSAARNALLAQAAEARGLRLSSDERAEVRRSWRDRVERWAEALGLTGLESEADVKRAALRALAAERQRARIARQEVLALAPVLRSMYPVRQAAADTTGAAGG